MHASPKRRQILTLLAASPWLATAARAQSAWPERDLRIVAPVPPGGTVDLLVRAMAEHMRQALGRPVVVDNRPGAGGLLGTKIASAAAPDGYTLAYLHSGLVTVQAMNPKLDLLKEFRMVARLTHGPFGLVVRADSPYKTAQELFAAVKAQPGKLTFGSGGVGSPAHLAVEHIEERIPGFKALHVPYKAATETVNAMIGGQVDFSVSVLGTLTPLVQSGKLRLLAITGRARLPQMPDVPTLHEAALPGYVFEPWSALAVPAGTPDAVVERLYQLMPATMATSAVKDVVAKGGSVIEVIDGKTFAAQLARDIPAEQALVKRLGMTMDQ